MIDNILSKIEVMSNHLSPIATVAQWYLESGYRPGNKMSDLASPPNHNLFGIKVKELYYDEKTKGLTWDLFPTKEWSNTQQKFIEVVAPFRIYHSYEDSIKDHDNFFVSTPPRITRYKKVREATNLADEIHELGESGYATDPNYEKKLLEIIKAYGLDNLFDTAKIPKFNKGGTKVVNFKRKTVDMFKGVAGWRGKPTGIMIHNDAGNPTGIGYESWLRSARMNNPEAGFAHDYVDSTSMLTVEGINYGAYAAANSTYNLKYHHIEICMQLSADDKRWSENTERAIMRAAEVCHIAGIIPSRSTFNLHTWVSRLGTSCPQRSAKQFGSYTAALEYFIQRTKHYMALGKTIEEMMGAKTPVTQTPIKPVDVPKTSFVAGRYAFKETVKVRSNPDLSTKSDTGLRYSNGDIVNIDRVVTGSLYVWGHYISYSGQDRWVALRDNTLKVDYVKST